MAATKEKSEIKKVIPEIAEGKWGRLNEIRYLNCYLQKDDKLFCCCKN